MSFVGCGFLERGMLVFYLRIIGVVKIMGIFFASITDNTG